MHANVSGKLCCQSRRRYLERVHEKPGRPVAITAPMQSRFVQHRHRSFAQKKAQITADRVYLLFVTLLSCTWWQWSFSFNPCLERFLDRNKDFIRKIVLLSTWSLLLILVRRPLTTLISVTIIWRPNIWKMNCCKKNEDVAISKNASGKSECRVFDMFYDSDGTLSAVWSWVYTALSWRTFGHHKYSAKSLFIIVPFSANRRCNAPLFHINLYKPFWTK